MRQAGGISNATILTCVRSEQSECGITCAFANIDLEPRKAKSQSGFLNSHSVNSNWKYYGHMKAMSLSHSVNEPYQAFVATNLVLCSSLKVRCLVV